MQVLCVSQLIIIESFRLISTDLTDVKQSFNSNKDLNLVVLDLVVCSLESESRFQSSVLKTFFERF